MQISCNLTKLGGDFRFMIILKWSCWINWNSNISLTAVSNVSANNRVNTLVCASAILLLTKITSWSLDKLSSFKCLLPGVADDSGLTEHWKYPKVWVSVTTPTESDNCPEMAPLASSDEDGLHYLESALCNKARHTALTWQGDHWLAISWPGERERVQWTWAPWETSGSSLLSR